MKGNCKNDMQKKISGIAEMLGEKMWGLHFLYNFMFNCIHDKPGSSF